MTGVGLFSTNVIRIIAAGDVCGADVAAVSTFVGLASTTSVAAYGVSYGVYRVATSEPTGGTAGALYKVCWGQC